MNAVRSSYSFAMILWELLNATTPFRDFLHGPGITPALARVRCIEIGESDLRPELPAPAERAAFFGTSAENISLIASLIQVSVCASVSLSLGLSVSLSLKHTPYRSAGSACQKSGLTLTRSARP